MIHRPFLIPFIVVFVFHLNAQEFSITGRIIDHNQQPLPFANVLLQTPDSVLIKGGIANETGYFVFESVAGEYLIAASYMGSISRNQVIQVTGHLDIGILMVTVPDEELDEVVVTQQRPTVEQLSDRLVFKVENTALSDSDIWSVLKRTPGIIVSRDRLTIQGSSNIGILINGKKVNIPQSDIRNLLSGNSAHTVQAIEVITSPPAKYSAEGGMLINIKMKKNLVAGYNGSVYNRFTQGVFPKNTLGTDHYFKSTKTDFSITYNYKRNKELVNYTDITHYFANGDINETWSAEQQSITRTRQHTLNAFVDHDLDQHNHISFSALSSLLPSLERTYDSRTLITDLNGAQVGGFDTNNEMDNAIFNTAFYLDWTHTMGEKGGELSTSAHYTFYDYSRSQEVQSVFFGNTDADFDNNFSTDTDQVINLYSFQMDWNKPLSKQGFVETGIRFAGIDSKSTIAQLGYDGAAPSGTLLASGDFTYGEQIYAAYASLNSKRENWQVKTGLRAEYTDTKGQLDAAIAKKNSYLEWFPSISAQHLINEKNNLNVNYYRRITRPRYNELNPFQYYQTVNSTIEGNPNLKPSFRNYASLRYTYDKTYSLVLFASQQKNEQSQLVFQDNDTKFIRFINSNLDTSYMYGADFSYNRDVLSFWNLYLLLSHYYDQNSFTDLGTGQVLDNTIWTTFIRANNSFTFLKDRSLYGDITFSYFSPSVYGSSRRRATSELGCSLRKSLWNKQASISLAIEDIFNGSNLYTSRDFLDQKNSSYIRKENRLLILGFRYGFGNTKIGGNQKRKSTDEGKRL